MTGSFGELGSLLKQAQQMQRDLDRVREELRARTVEGVSANGGVKVLVTGDRQVTKITITPELFAKADKTQIEELLLAALADGFAKASRVSTEALGKVTGGIHLPGLF
jgi:nucleoid-associated protein EbfC